MNILSCGGSGIVYSHILVRGRSRRTCEDVVFTRSTSRFLLCGLADGQSGAKYGAYGGRACLEAVFECVDRQGIDAFFSAPFPDELPWVILRAVRQRLTDLAQRRQADIKDFASTLLALVVELRTGRYMLLHLGDGCAIAVPKAGDPAVLSAPDNGATLRHTWLTTSANAVAHLRVAFGTLEGKARLLLLSDGAVSLCRGGTIPRRAKEPLKTDSQRQLFTLLSQSAPADDAACLILDFATLAYA